MTSFDIKLLGGSRFYLGSTAEHSFTTKKSQALLIYLVVNAGNRISRDTLCELLWHRSALEQAKGSLRQALTQVRRALKNTPLEDAITDESGLMVTIDESHLDTARFETLCKTSDMASWQEASDIYSDEFLAGFHVNEPGFQNWATAQRAYYYNLAVTTQKKLIKALLDAQAHEEAIAACRRLLVLDEFDEWGVIALMRTYAATGRRSDAIKLYQTYSTNVKEELDAAPGSDAETLFEKIRTDVPVDASTVPIEPRLRQEREPSSDKRPVIEVLPFDNTSPEQKDSWITAGLTEDIIIGLSRSSILRVLDRNQLFGRKTGEDPIGTKLPQSATYALKGSISIENNRIRIGVGLIENGTQRVCWAKRYERPYTDLFSVQREIVDALVSILEPVVIEQEQKVAFGIENDSLEHWHLFMQGRWHFWRTTPTDNKKAQDLLKQALALKPDDVTTLFTLAFSHMASAWVFCDEDTDKSVDAAFTYAEAAIKADPQDPWAHLAMGTAHSCRGDLQRAIAEQKFALDLNPYFAASRGELARLYALTGNDVAKAFEYADKALEESPADPHSNLWKMAIGLAHFRLGNKEEAMAAAIEAVTQRPFWFQNHFLLCVCEHEAGNLVAARKALQDGLNLTRNYTLAAFKTGHPFERSEDMERFLTILKKCGWDY